MRELLNKMTKQEIIDLVCNLCEDDKIDKSVIEFELHPKKITDEQLSILGKLDRKEQLVGTDLLLVTETLQQKQNVKVASLLKSSDAFIKELVNYKVNSLFSHIWKIYPRKVGKDLGLKAFTKLVGERKYKDLDAYCSYIGKRILQYKQNCEDCETEPQYILHFSTFCNSKKYL